MSKFIVLASDGTVGYTFPEIDPVRHISANELYAPDFLETCLIVDDDVEFPAGYLYDNNTGTFTPPPDFQD